jgi:hypothetical protein
MDGMTWVIVGQILAVVFLATALVRRRRLFDVESNSRQSLSCETPMSMRRVSRFKSLLFLAARECPHCGNRIRSRKRVAGTAS